MSKEAMKLALDALQKIYIAPEHEEYIRVWWPACEEAITALREALANEALDKKAENARELGLDYEPAQQEPVAWLSEGGNFSFEPWQRSIPLYTSPPAQRTWQGLTDDEVIDIAGSFDYRYDVARAAEDKLKEKNT